MKRIIYYNPQQNIERGEQPIHSFLWLDDIGDVLGQLDARHVSEPDCQFEVLSFTYAPSEEPPVIFGDLLQAFADFLIERKNKGSISRKKIPSGVNYHSSEVISITP